METSKKQKVDRHEMPCQPADVRRRNFKEVALGYDEATALAEAGRCLQCKKPLCVSGFFPCALKRPRLKSRPRTARMKI